MLFSTFYWAFTQKEIVAYFAFWLFWLSKIDFSSSFNSPLYFVIYLECGTGVLFFTSSIFCTGILKILFCVLELMPYCIPRVQCTKTLKPIQLGLLAFMLVTIAWFSEASVLLPWRAFFFNKKQFCKVRYFRGLLKPWSGGTVRWVWIFFCCTVVFGWVLISCMLWIGFFSKTCSFRHSPQDYRRHIQIHYSFSIYKPSKMLWLAIFHLSWGHLVYTSADVFA